LTLDDVNRLFKHWQKYPPLRDLVAAFIGFEIPDDEPEAPKQYMTAEGFKQLMGMTGGRVPGMS